MRLKSLFSWKGRKEETRAAEEYAQFEEDDLGPSTASSASFFSPRAQPISRHRRERDSADPPVPTVERRLESTESSARMQSGDDALGLHTPVSTRLSPPDSPTLHRGNIDFDGAQSARRESPAKNRLQELGTPRRFVSEPERRLDDREAELPIGRALSMSAALLPGGSLPPRKGDGQPWFDDESEDSDEASDKPSSRPMLSPKPDAGDKFSRESTQAEQKPILRQESRDDAHFDVPSERPAARSALRNLQAEIKPSSSQISVSSGSEPVTTPHFKAGGSMISHLASLSYPSEFLRFLIYGMSVERVSSQAAAASQRGDTVRQIVESAYADAIQEEARGPGGGLRRIVELLRRNEANRVAVENIAVAIIVLSENDAVASSAFGNHNALEALLNCVRRYETDADVMKRVVGALRTLVGSSRRNAKLLQAHDSLFMIAATGASPKFVNEPRVAEEALRIVATVLLDGPMTHGNAVGGKLASNGAAGIPATTARRAQAASARQSLPVLFSSVLSAMCLHPERPEIQVAGMLALRTVLAQPGRGDIPTLARMDMLESVGGAFRAHAGAEPAVGWLALALYCDAELVGDAHACAQLDLGCFFASLRRALTEVEAAGAAADAADATDVTDAADAAADAADEAADARAALVARALTMAAHVGWRVAVPQQTAVYSGAVQTCLDALRVFRAQPEVLEAVCGLVHGLFDSPDACALIEASSNEFADEILGAVCELTAAPRCTA